MFIPKENKVIFDILPNLKKYKSIPYVDEIAEFLSSNDLVSLEEGDIPIKGDDLFVKVLSYVPNPEEENNFETHRDYMDVQVVVQGVEKMQVVAPENLEEKVEVEMDGDFQFFKASQQISDLIVKNNKFVVFFPGEPHRPGCRYLDLNQTVKKIVFKVRIVI